MSLNYPEVIERLEDKGYDSQQINQILKGFDIGIELYKYYLPETDINTIRIARELYKKYKSYNKEIITNLFRNCLNKSIDIMPLYEGNYNYCTSLLRMKLMLKGLDVSKLKNNNYNKTQCNQIHKIMISEKNYKDYDIFFNKNLRSKDYKMLKELIDNEAPFQYYLDQGYNLKQLEIINRYYKQLIDITPFCDYNCTLEKMNLIGETLRQMMEGYTSINKDFLLKLSERYEYGPLNEIILAYDAGIDINLMLEKEYNRHQLSIIGKGLYNNIDASIYADPKYSAAQMEVIMQFLTRITRAEVYISYAKYKNYDISIILDETLSPEDMKFKMDAHLKLTEKGVPNALHIAKTKSVKELKDILDSIKHIDSDFEEDIKDILKSISRNDEER